MHMLSLFPQILFLAPFSATIIRISLATILVWTAWEHVSINNIFLRVLGIVEIALAIALFVGAWSQGAALASTLVVLVWFFVPGIRRFSRSTVLLCLVLSLSILVTGAGAFAFDLPL